MGNVDATKYHLGKLGYSLFEIDEEINVAKLIIDVIKTRDLRLIKSIPFIIYQTEGINFKEIALSAKKSKLQKEINLLIYLTQKIFAKLKIKKNTRKLNTFLKENISKKQEDFFETKKNEKRYLAKLSFTIHSINSFSEEMYKDFLMNKKLSEIEDKERLHKKISQAKELDLKFALSKLFKKKQREIINNILHEKELTKTEYEYYIRTIKKKLDAITQLKEISETVLRKKVRKFKGK